MPGSGSVPPCSLVIITTVADGAGSEGGENDEPDADPPLCVRTVVVVPESGADGTADGSPSAAALRGEDWRLF